jgi:putrescine transport system ATP-binding protein
MTLADRIAVMDQGQVRQIGSPTEIYEFPRTRFVASFIGSITTFDAVVSGHSDGLLRVEVAAFGKEILARAVPEVSAGQPVTLAVRPEKITISRTEPLARNAVQGVVKDLAYFGKDSLYRITLPSGALVQVHAVNAHRGDEAARVADWDDRVWLSFDPSAAIVLEAPD